MKSARVGAKLSNMRISRKWAVAWAQDLVLAKLDGAVRVDGDVCSRGRMMDVQQRQGVREPDTAQFFKTLRPSGRIQGLGKGRKAG